MMKMKTRRMKMRKMVCSEPSNDLLLLQRPIPINFRMKYVETHSLLHNADPIVSVCYHPFHQLIVPIVSDCDDSVSYRRNVQYHCCAIIYEILLDNDSQRVIIGFVHHVVDR